MPPSPRPGCVQRGGEAHGGCRARWIRCARDAFQADEAGKANGCADVRLGSVLEGIAADCMLRVRLAVPVWPEEMQAQGRIGGRLGGEAVRGRRRLFWCLPSAFGDLIAKHEPCAAPQRVARLCKPSLPGQNTNRTKRTLPARRTAQPYRRTPASQTMPRVRPPEANLVCPPERIMALLE